MWYNVLGSYYLRVRVYFNKYKMSEVINLKKFKEWVKTIHFYHLYFIQLALAFIIVIVIVTSPLDPDLGYFTMKPGLAFIPVVIYSIMTLIHIFEYVSKIHQIKPYLRFFFLGFFSFFAISLIGASIHDINQVLFITAIFYILVLQISLIEHRWQEKKPQLPKINWKLPDGWYSIKNYKRFFQVSFGAVLMYIALLIIPFSSFWSKLVVLGAILGIFIVLMALYYSSEAFFLKEKYEKDLDYTRFTKQLSSLRRFDLKPNATEILNLLEVKYGMYQDLGMAYQNFQNVEIPTKRYGKLLYYMVGLRLYFLTKEYTTFHKLYEEANQYFTKQKMTFAKQEIAFYTNYFKGTLKLKKAAMKNKFQRAENLYLAYLFYQKQDDKELIDYNKEQLFLFLNYFPEIKQSIQ